MSAWLLSNINRDSSKQSTPFTLEEVTAWLGYSGRYVRNEAKQEQQIADPPPIDELKNKLDIVHMLHKGLYGENGQREEGE